MNKGTCKHLSCVAERDRFYALVGETSPRSNTGIAGISETVNWRWCRAYPCFSVTVGDARRHRPVRFYYGLAPRAPRLAALSAAIAFRTRHTGEDPVKLIRQATEVGCA